MQMNAVPVYGGIPCLHTTYAEKISKPLQLAVKSYAPYKRFAVEIVDDGLDTAGLRIGDYAIFREQGWPNDELQVVCIAFGNDTETISLCLACSTASSNLTSWSAWNSRRNSTGGVNQFYTVLLKEILLRSNKTLL
ncbi:hypothetical protein ACOALA_10140 [Alicyclobacillus acidoterrestris]|uniref:hypothetical protein n=1 Tax=Alicyclobacillus acidoterrestris TaxID=1450 RepID=UPI003F529CA8